MIMNQRRRELIGYNSLKSHKKKGSLMIRRIGRWMLKKDIEVLFYQWYEKCGVVNNNMSNNVEGEILEDHFDGDRGNDTIEDNADVNPSTIVSLEVNIQKLQLIH
ncbi:hypothetical protein Tco_1530137 [Tanacetum coccineum]